MVFETGLNLAYKHDCTRVSLFLPSINDSERLYFNCALSQGHVKCHLFHAIVSRSFVVLSLCSRSASKQQPIDQWVSTIDIQQQERKYIERFPHKEIAVYGNRSRLVVLSILSEAFNQLIYFTVTAITYDL